MIEFIRANAHYITLVALVVACICGWLFFSPDDWSGK